MSDLPGFDVPGLIIVWGADAPGPAGRAPIVSDFIVDTSSSDAVGSVGDTDLIATDVHTVVTGSLVPVSNLPEGANGVPFRVQRVVGGGFTTDFQPDGIVDANDTFNAFTIRNNSDINTRRAEIFTSFYVASNTGFAVDAVARPIGSTSARDFNRMRLGLTVTASGDDGLAFGSAAQFPHTGDGPSSGSQATNRRLSTLATPRRVFTGDRRTARLRGSISEQSVRFDLRYRYNSGNIDLSDGVIDAAAEVVYTLYVP